MGMNVTDCGNLLRETISERCKFRFEEWNTPQTTLRAESVRDREIPGEQTLLRCARHAEMGMQYGQ